MRTFKDFVDYILTQNATIKVNDVTYTIRAIVDAAHLVKIDYEKTLTTNNIVEFITDFLSAGLYGGSLVAPRNLQDNKIEKFIPTGLSEIFYSFSKGTTGAPRVVSHNIDQLWKNAEKFINAIELTNDSVYLNNVVAPPSGELLHYIVIPVLISGATLVDAIKAPAMGQPPEYASRGLIGFGTLLTKYKPSHALVFGYTIPLFNRVRSFRTADLSHVKYFMLGGTMVTPGSFDTLKKLGANPVQVFSTQDTGIIAVSADEEYLGNNWLPGVEWKSEDDVLFYRCDGQEWIDTGDVIDIDSARGPKILGSKQSQFIYRNTRISPEEYENAAKINTNVIDAFARLENGDFVFYYYGNISEPEVYMILQNTEKFKILPVIVHRLKDYIPKTVFAKPIRNSNLIIPNPIMLSEIIVDPDFAAENIDET